MARPEKPDTDKRNFIIRLRVTRSEKSRIWREVQDAGLTPSDFLRSLVLQTRPARKVPTTDRAILLKFLAEAGKQGSNLNQLARAVNRKPEGDAPGGLDIGLLHQALRQNNALKTLLMQVLTA